MEFNFISTVYVSEDDLEEICSLVENGMPVEDAIEEVARGWDDFEYYNLGCIEYDLTMEINRRLGIEEER